MASKSHQRFASEKDLDRLVELDLPDQVGDGEPGQRDRRDGPQHTPVHRESNRCRCTHRPAVDVGDGLDHVADVVVGVGGESGSDRISSPARSAIGSRGWWGTARDTRSAGGRAGSGSRSRSGPRRARAGARRGSCRTAPDRSARHRDAARACRGGRGRVARSRRAREPLVVELELPPPALGVVVELVELHERDRREHVGEVRLVAGHGEVVERAVAAAHQAEVADRVGHVAPLVETSPPSPAAMFFVA